MPLSEKFNIFLFRRPLIKVLDKLLLVGVLSSEDIDQMLMMVHPETWDPNFDKGRLFKISKNYLPVKLYLYKLLILVGKDKHRKGIIQMKIHEGVKLQICYLLHHLCDVQLRHRIEYTVAFCQDYMGDLQSDQLRRYIEIKQSDMPSAVAAKKTKEFRCPPREQVRNS